MSGLDDARVEAIASRKMGYGFLVATILVAVLCTVYDLWPIWAFPLSIAGYLLGRSSGLAEARSLMRR